MGLVLLKGSSLDSSIIICFFFRNLNLIHSGVFLLVFFFSETIKYILSFADYAPHAPRSSTRTYALEETHFPRNMRVI